jgi:RNA 3'-terminal phosphate cyclase (ATP)
MLVWKHRGSLILQTVVVPLALVPGASTLVVRGGTHLDRAPAYDDFANAYLPALRSMGLSADAELKAWGWDPAGGGEVMCTIEGVRTRPTLAAPGRS